MELIITKNGHILARTRDNDPGESDNYELRQEATIPDYPAEKPGRGKSWELDYDDQGRLVWVLVDRPLTMEERVEDLEENTHAWKPGEAVKVGDRRYYNGAWYICIQAHTTQADWTPDITPALWKKED